MNIYPIIQFDIYIHIHIYIYIYIYIYTFLFIVILSQHIRTVVVLASNLHDPFQMLLLDHCH